MSASEKLAGFEEMSTSERILLLQELWDRIAADPDHVEVTPTQRDELARRLAAHETNPGQVKTWEEVKKGLRRPR